MSVPPPRDPSDPVDPVDPLDPVDPIEPGDPYSLDPMDETMVRDEWTGETVIAGNETMVVGDETVVVEEEEEVVPVRRPPLVWPWLLAFLLLVLGGLGAYYYFSQEDERTVPAVVGQRQEGAEANVREAGFEPESERQASAKPRGVVLDQRPDGGTELEEGETVFLIVSNGPPRETVPDVVGETTEAAVADLTASSFESDVTEAFSDKKAGVVLAQEPAAGANLKEGSSVALTVSKGPEPVEVPDVVGTTSSEATAALRDAGLGVNLVPVPSDRPAGTVVAQSPAAGATAKSGAKVRLNVAQAANETTPAATTAPTTTEAAPPPTTTAPPPQPATTTAPDAVGQELAVGARSFGDAGLKVAVRYVPSQEAQGRIVAQAQPAGTELRRGDTVQVNVSTGAEPAPATAVPNVMGAEQERARSLLEDAQFEVLAIELATADQSKIGRVLSQSPPASAQIPRGSLVILYIGAAQS
ncbi:MAG TPA: PASTA domain-containing protein [Gaiellaceae bacterium]|nr:PASTA domain-containing protein [Gaiellaceae bacterium]